MIKINELEFQGPYINTSSLEARAGIYAILDEISEARYLIDVGESSEVKTRVEKHDRQPCWTRNRRGTLMVAVLYTPYKGQVERIKIERAIRDKYKPSCGDI